MEELKQLTAKADNLTKKLVEATKNMHDGKGTSEDVIDQKLVNQLKELAERKTNAPTASGTANAAAEIYPGTMTLTSVLRDDELSPDFEFLKALAPARTDLGKGANEDLPLVTEPGLVRGITEWSTGNVNVAAGFNNLNTAKVSITTKQLGNAVDITKYLEKFGVVSALAEVRRQDAMAYAYSIATAIVNGDSSTGATGNINSDDQLALTTYPVSADGFPTMYTYYTDSLRKKAIAAGAGVGTIDVGAPAGVADFFDVAKLMKSHGRANPRNRIILMNNETYFSYMSINDFKDASINGAKSTITEGAITNIGGMDVFVTDVMQLTEADGKLS